MLCVRSLLMTAIVIFAALGAIRAAMADLPQSSRVQLRALIWVFVQVGAATGPGYA